MSKTTEVVKPNFQTRSYRPCDVAFIRDRWQSFNYCKRGVYPIDMYVSTSDDLVMVFDKKETKKLYRMYRNREFQKELGK